ncbi:YIP1 family protein [Cypionkella aquatica]|uniref:YIP1 family protein n=1 Tax=Cypionkella aquatica TaxID=1756042 RepID=A0AA37WY48_9RHOB|nr:Yip1 family protein [Cypionkella aquatica]GLS85083.1 YIP1 family protein [Cypionkella aquatica]
MQAELGHVLQLTVQNPRAAARRLMGWQLPVSTVWLMIALMAVISACLSSVSFLLTPAPSEPSVIDPNLLAIFTNPLQIALLQGLVLVIMAMLAQGIGRLFGGTGSFPDALILIAWTEALLCLIQLAQTILMLATPSIAAALGMFGIVLFVWVLSNFIAELHGFQSTGKVLFGIVGTVFAISFLMALATVGLLELKG